MKILNCGICIDSTPNGFQTAFQSISSDYRELNCSHPNFNQEILKIAESFSPDLIVLQIQSQGIISRETCQKLAQKSFVINFNGDKRQITPPWMLDIGEVIQLTCFSNGEDVKNCKDYGINAEFLPYAIDPLKYNRHGVEMSDVPEIVFMGNNYGDLEFPLSHFRRQLVEAMYDEFGNRFGVWGANWGRSMGNLNSDQKAESIIYNNSKLAISVSHFSSSRYVSDRLHRAHASSICTLSHGFKDYSLDYINKENIIIFETISECIEKCYYYLENSEERNRIAQNGYNLAHSNYTFKNFSENIIKLYQKYSK